MAILSMIAFLLTSWPEVRRAIWWRENVEVVSFDSEGVILLANRGDGDLYVSTVLVGAEGVPRSFSVEYPIDAALQPGTMRACPVISPFSNSGTIWVSVARVTDEEWLTAQRRAADGFDKCFRFVFYDENNSRLPREKGGVRSEPRSFRARAVLRHTSARNGKTRTTEFPVFGIVQGRTGKECGFVRKTQHD